MLKFIGSFSDHCVCFYVPSMLPRHKYDIASRLVRGAMAVGYRMKDEEYQGPFPNKYSASEKDKTVIVDFGPAKIQIRSNSGFEVCCIVSCQV